MGAEDIIRNKARSLSAEKQAEVIDFIEFLLQKEARASQAVAGQDWLKWGAGLHREIWQSVDSTDFLQRERANWD